MRLFMWLDFYLHFWSVQKPDKETNYVTVLRLLFSTEVSYFFAKSKTTKEILMVLLANLTSYNEWEFTYFFNKWSAGEPPSYLFHCQQGQTTLSFVTSRTHFEGGMVAKKKLGTKLDINQRNFDQCVINMTTWEMFRYLLLS